jgi:hypothetical protein
LLPNIPQKLIKVPSKSELHTYYGIRRACELT